MEDLVGLARLHLVHGQQLVGSRGQDLHRGMGRQPWQTPSKWDTSAKFALPHPGPVLMSTWYSPGKGQAPGRA